MKLLLSPYFYITSILFVLNQLLEKLGIVIPYVHAYLDDLLTGGIVLGFALFIIQQFVARSPSFVFSRGYAISFVLWYSLLFEIIFPYFDARHYSDPWDVLCYSVGTLLFMKLGNKPARKISVKPFLKLRGN